MSQTNMAEQTKNQEKLVGDFEFFRQTNIPKERIRIDAIKGGIAYGL